MTTISAFRTRPRSGLRLRAAAWARGRSWLVRLPLLVWLGYIFVRHLVDPRYRSLFGGLDLGIHELGHFVFQPLGTFMAIAGGSILQCLAPVAAMWMFRRQEDYFGIAVAWCWLGMNLFGVATYAADARARLLPLVSPVSGDPIHDWAYLLGSMDVLRHDTMIGAALRLAAVLAFTVGLLGGAWLLWTMARTEPEQGGSPPVRDPGARTLHP